MPTGVTEPDLVRTFLHMDFENWCLERNESAASSQVSCHFLMFFLQRIGGEKALESVYVREGGLPECVW